MAPAQDALRDPAQKEQALRVIHSLSPDAAYRNILTQLDFKVRPELLPRNKQHRDRAFLHLLLVRQQSPHPASF
eukprot:957340-Rhodomonas_salina.2